MIIEETQEGGITRQFDLPEQYRERWIEFFQWLVDEEVILDFQILN